ncbi:10240_t:CDS:2 [Acaulospora morrowiae]|uniref:10240_t:CDS:1 n=1 Tax=Acaulospora morrowiae TaxID=94023 RepID=A0A9N8ZJJ5_9GLOM|nr:10240_t:CDS:2 [Acaulospora morrowiae]
MTTKSNFLNSREHYVLSETDTSEDGLLNTSDNFYWHSHSSTSHEYDSDSNSKNSDWPEYGSDSTSEIESKYSNDSYNVKKSKLKEKRHDLNSGSGNDSDTSRGSSTITDDSFSTIIGDTSQEEDGRINEDDQYDSFDEYSPWMPEVSSGTDDSTGSECTQKKRRKLGSNSISCCVCGGPDLYFNYICICVGCNEGYHQMCHEPKISDSTASYNIEERWHCMDCQMAIQNGSSAKSANRAGRREAEVLQIANKRYGNFGPTCHEQAKETIIFEEHSMSIKTIGKNNQNIINIRNDDNSIQNQKIGLYQQRSDSKCLSNGFAGNNLRGDRQDCDKESDNDVLLHSRINSDPNNKSRIITKKRLRNTLTFVPLASEKRHSTATELHKLFYENYPISKVNFDDIFKPEDWGRSENTDAPSVRNIGTHVADTELLGKSFSPAKKNGVIPKKIIVVNKNTLKNSIGLNKNGSSLNKNSPMANGKKIITHELNVNVATNKNVTPTKKPSTPPRSTIFLQNPDNQEHSSSDESVSLTQTVASPKRNVSLRDVVECTPKIVTPPNKSFGPMNHDDEDFNIISLLPRNLIPCINFGTLAFREGTIDPKRGQVKRGRVFSVVK